MTKRVGVREYLLRNTEIYHDWCSRGNREHASEFLASTQRMCKILYPGEYTPLWIAGEIELVFDDAAEESWFWLVYS